MSQINQHFFSENDAKPFEEQLFNFWNKRIDKRWFWLAFQALEKAGLTYYETDDENILVRERMVILAIIYYEYCHRSAAHESENFTYWREDMILEIKKYFSDNISDHILEVRLALIKYFTFEVTVTDELWLNCFEGRNNIILPFDKKSKVLSENNINKTDAEEWFFGGKDEIDSYESISL